MGYLKELLNLDPKIQIRYVDTEHQLADILTKGNFTRDEWNNLLCLFNISHFSSLCCDKNFSLISCITERMAKRMQEQSEENRTVAKSRPTTTNLTCSDATSSSSVNSPDLRREARGCSKLQVDRLDYQGGLMQAHRSSRRFQTPKKVELGHIISVNHQTVYLTWKKVISIVRKICDRKPTDDLKDLDVNTGIWCIFMSVTL